MKTLLSTAAIALLAAAPVMAASQAPADATVTGEAAVSADAGMVSAMTQADAEALTGALVYDSNDDHIGEIAGFVADGQTGTPVAALIDVGGLLGLGEHRVAAPLDMIKVTRADGDATVHVDATAEALKHMPEYEGK